MRRLLCAVILTATACMVAVAYARGPVISAAHVRAALASRGIVAGAGTMIDGQTYVIDRMHVGAEGDWIVVRILPKRMR